MPNPNTLFANSFIDALVAAGLRRVCIAPGSRHTSLALALARHRESIEIYSLLDERSAAFFALGLALGSAEPAGLVCTSGSAAANFFPAIVEAQQSRLPLIVLSADRPHERRYSGANQTIDQIKLFGDYVDYFVDAPLPEANPPALARRNLQTLAARAVNIAERRRAVVHINLPFRKPFEPGADDAGWHEIDRSAPTQFLRRPPPGASGLADVLSAELRARPGLIYFGHGACRSEAERAALGPWARRLSAITGYPILAEFSSNMRSRDAIATYECLIESEAVDMSEVEVVIRFGAPPLPSNMSEFLARARLRAHIFCSRDGAWADDSHSVSHHLTMDPQTVSTAEWGAFEPAPGDWSRQWSRAAGVAGAVIAEEIGTGAYFDGAALYDLVDLLPAGSTLFAGNSLPIRHLDQFGLSTDKAIWALANRGASGIDGNVSSALGAGAARRRSPLVAVLGDITLYHDMNGLLAIRRCDIPLTLVLLNNNGGGIFHRLPVRGFEPHFSDYFLTPHGLDFALVAELYGLDYVRADDRAAFRRALSRSVGGGASTLIEVRTDAVADLKRRRDIMTSVYDRLRKG